MKAISKVSILDLGEVQVGSPVYYKEDEESDQIGTHFFSAAEEILFRFGNPVVLLFDKGLTVAGSNRVHAHEGKYITPELFAAMTLEWKKYRITGDKSYVTTVDVLDPFMRYVTSGPSAFSFVDRTEVEAFIARNGTKPTYFNSRGIFHSKIIGDKSILYTQMSAKDGTPSDHYLKITSNSTLRLHKDLYPELLGDLPEFVNYIDFNVAGDYSLGVVVYNDNNEIDKSFDLKTKSAGKMYTHLDAIEKVKEIYGK